MPSVTMPVRPKQSQSRPPPPAADDTDDDFLVVDDQDGILVIGIDFGTTFSGVAWATTEELEDNPNDINLIMNWPGTGREESKAPSELCYNDDGTIGWGFEVPPEADSIRWFKLLLLRDDDMGEELRNVPQLSDCRDFLKRTGKSAVDVVADYLGMLWKHTIETIVRARGQTVVDAMVIRTVITVPAIWKGYARQAMEKAAKKAGMLEKRPAGPTSLVLANEPEAAALATLIERGRKPSADSVYIVCDAGGGTVRLGQDLISYKVEQVNPISALCGGIFIDEAFENLCYKQFGLEWVELSKTAARHIIRDDWEFGIKPQFRKNCASKAFTVRVPSEISFKSAVGVKNGRMHFSGYYCRGAHQGNVERCNNVSSAIQTHVILVGGLGSSPYLYDYLDEIYAGTGVSILQSTGTKPQVVPSQGRRILPPSTHKTYTNLPLAAKKGQDVPECKPVRSPFYHLLYPGQTPRVSLDLVECERPDAPTRKTSAVTPLCTLSFKVDLEREELQEFTNSNCARYHKLSFEVEMIPAGASVEFVVYVDGRKQGARNVNVRFE
uniref:Hsp70-like protein n=1 Tax=Pyricularia oryzae (strain P131) TaxID=1143193 RepID=L7J4E5_PYRO1